MGAPHPSISTGTTSEGYPLFEGRGDRVFGRASKSLKSLKSIRYYFFRFDFKVVRRKSERKEFENSEW